jgi:hypothetical protein
MVVLHITGGGIRRVCEPKSRVDTARREQYDKKHAELLEHYASNDRTPPVIISRISGQVRMDNRVSSENPRCYRQSHCHCAAPAGVFEYRNLCRWE